MNKKEILKFHKLELQQLRNVYRNADAETKKVIVQKYKIANANLRKSLAEADIEELADDWIIPSDEEMKKLKAWIFQKVNLDYLRNYANEMKLYQKERNPAILERCRAIYNKNLHYFAEYNPNPAVYDKYVAGDVAGVMKDYKEYIVASADAIKEEISELKNKVIDAKIECEICKEIENG